MNKRSKYFLAVLCMFFFLPIMGMGKKEKIYLQNLRCELSVNPLGIDVVKPRLSWEIYGNGRGIEQTHYQIVVASSKEKLLNGIGDIWNSGKVKSDQSIHVVYAGSVLKSGSKYFWRARVWTNKGASSWSKVQYWTMGLLNPEDWKAAWIGLDRSFPWDNAKAQFSRLSARYFRKEFKCTKNIQSATVFICGLGYYQLYLNGRRIGHQVLTPSPTDYTKSVLYNTYDVTDDVKTGKNAIGTILGNGLFFTMRQNYKTYKIRNFGFPKMILQLEIKYADGTKKTIVSNSSWKVTADGPMRTNNIYDGAEYDARKTMPGWNTVAFNDTTWLPVELVSAPGGRLKAQMSEKVKVMDTINPVTIHYLRPGVYIMDMGQNMAGWIKMKVKGKRGRQVTLRFAETLQQNGELATTNLREAKATDVYTLSGEGLEVWEPAFVYHGFRYVEITNYPGIPDKANFSGMVVYDGLKTTGNFESSNTLLNKIYHNACWGINSNYKGLPVDCPQRDERMPWMGDRTMSSYGESFIFGNAKLYAQWLEDIDEAQTADGIIPDVAPAFWKYYIDDVAWPAAYFQVAEMLYHQYGLLRPIEKHYPSMKRWVRHIERSYMENYLIYDDKFGDWCMPPKYTELIHAKEPSRITDGTLIGTAYYYHILDLMSRFAERLNKKEDRLEYLTLAGKIRSAFNKKFLNKTTGQYSNNTVTANLLPLIFGITPQAYLQEVFDNIVKKTIKAYDRHISTGTLGTQWIMRGITKYGRPDLAFSIVNTTEYPGWGYMVANGATTIWELWNGDKANPWMCSRNHVMLLGDLVVWYFEDVAGIKSSVTAPGFKQIIMKPQLTDSLQFVDASYHSVHGLITSNWEKNDKAFYWDISIPGNTSAVVYLPASSPQSVTENGISIDNADNVKFEKMKNGFAIIKLKSGHYEFKSLL